jgi:hypothetical protein
MASLLGYRVRVGERNENVVGAGHVGESRQTSLKSRVWEGKL